ncbi:HAD-IA family hydrolase [Deinococcus cavernae]
MDSVKAVLFDRDDTLSTTDFSVYQEAAQWMESQWGTPAQHALNTLAEHWRGKAQAWWHLRSHDEERAFWSSYSDELAGKLNIHREQARELAEQYPYEKYLKAVPNARAVLLALRGRGLKIGVLSNTLPSIERTLEAIGLGDVVDVALATCTLGVHKPELEAFTLAAQAMQVHPREVLFVDDRQENVDAARQVGMHAYLIDLGGQHREALHSLDELLALPQLPGAQEELQEGPRLDTRTHAYDEQQRRADITLQGKLPGEGWQWVTPRRALTTRRTTLKAGPDAGATQVSEALPGEALELLWREGEWWRARGTHDAYLGWVKEADVTEATNWTPDLTVQALRAHAFEGPKVSSRIVAELCLGAALQRREADGEAQGNAETPGWVPVTLPGGQAAWVNQACFVQPSASVTELALRFLEAPYVWGGRSAWGLDCSGFTQLVYAAFGQALPRDADQQQAATRPVESPRAGDLAFFPGHVGLMLDDRRMIHANATGMRVTIETLGEGEYGERLAASRTGFGRVQ